MYTCIIIDDESKARILLKNMLLDIDASIRVVADCDDLPSGVKAIKKLKPHIIFLDIEMPGYSGLRILDFFEEDEIDFDIVFTTGYSEYAIQAFKLSATDYLLKPINPESLQTTIEKIQRKEERFKTQHYKALQENILNNIDANDKCIIVNLSGSTRFIKIKEIIMLEADGSYCHLYVKQGEKITTSKNLKYFEERLGDFPFFFRCHKSNIINLKQVIEYNKSENEIILNNKLKALVSTEKAEQFLQRMEAMH